MKKLDGLELHKRETKSLLGEAKKHILISQDRKNKFFVKHSKASDNRSDHGAKEIITEKIMTEIANYFMKSAVYSLVLYENRLAIRSIIFTYYGKKNDFEYRAIHGDEIFEFNFNISPPKKRKQQKNFYKLEKIEESILNYPTKYDLGEQVGQKLLSRFRLMLLVDAFLGNQDRHHQNWCLILRTCKKDENKNETSKHSKEKKLYFSPLFDTGRGLFWNENVYELIEKYKDQKAIEKYIKASSPLFHVENLQNANHFNVAEYIAKKDPEIFRFFSLKLKDLPIPLIFRPYSNLISPVRIVKMKKVLYLRKAELLKI